MSDPYLNALAIAALSLLAVRGILSAIAVAADPRPWYERLAAWVEQRDRHRRIHRDGESLYLSRYYLIGSRDSRWFAVALHRFHRGDSDPHRHNHPWWCWCSIVIAGGYWEDTPAGYRFRRPGDIGLRPGSWLHRVELDERTGPVWTLFIMGPRTLARPGRPAWGFMTPVGLVGVDDYQRWSVSMAETERLAASPRRSDHPITYDPDSDRFQVVDHPPGEAVGHGH